MPELNPTENAGVMWREHDLQFTLFNNQLMNGIPTHVRRR